MGRLIVIEGLDGSGKATQAAMLAERLRGGGSKTRELRFPCYEDQSSLFVRMYLKGEFGDNPEAVNCYAASMFYAADRYVSYKKQWEKEYESDVIFVADRYTTSNAVYQMSKLKKEEWDGYLGWLVDFEYKKLSIPSPDAVFFLDISPKVSERMMMERYGGDKEKMDIHERDIEYQQKSREAALYCAKSEGWRVIDCGGENMKSRQEIADEIFVNVQKLLKSIK